jgi:hypothetical protein
MTAIHAHATMEELLEAVFSVLSVHMLYNEGQLRLRETLEMAVRIIGGWYETAGNFRGQCISCETIASQ